MSLEEQGAKNTDRELWREVPDDFYSPSVHITEGGGLGINVGGLVFVKTPREWHKLAMEARNVRVVCDETTNTPEDVKANVLKGSIEFTEEHYKELMKVVDLSEFAPKLEDVKDEDLFIFTENPTNGAVTNAQEKGDRIVIWLLRVESGQNAHEVCREAMEWRGIEPTPYVGVYYTARTPDEYALSDFREEFLARMKDGKPWVRHEPAGFTTAKKPLTVNCLDYQKVEFIEQLINASAAILANTFIKCACGWKGLVKDAPDFKDGYRICPECRAHEGIEGGKKEETDSDS